MGVVSLLEPLHIAALAARRTVAWQGVRIAVGTDSLASNTALDMVAELRALGDVPLEELLAWATGNGAQALGMEERLGGFEAGSRSGAVLLSGLDWGNMRLTEDSRAERLL